MPQVFVANCGRGNWDSCRQGFIFGIRKGRGKRSRPPKISPGAIFLMRVTGQARGRGPEPGTRGIWAFTSMRKVQQDHPDVPWTDAKYEWLLSFSPLVREFKEPFDEEFKQRQRAWSEKIQMYAGEICRRSVVGLSPKQARNYLLPLIQEKQDELKDPVDYLGQRVVPEALLREIAEGAKSTVVPMDLARGPPGPKIVIFNVGSREANEHFNQTVLKSIPLGEVLALASADTKNRLTGLDEIQLWGSEATPRNIPRWEQVSRGDLVLFYKEKKFVALASIVATDRNERIARQVWGELPSGTTWELLYLLHDVVPTNIALPVFNQAFQYVSSYIPYGFTVMDEVRVNEFSQRYPGVDLRAKILQLEETSEISETDSVCSQIAAIVNVAEHIEATTSKERIIEWTRALRGFAAPRADETLDAWTSSRDFEKLSELYEYISEVRAQIADLPRSVEFATFRGLDKSESAAICAFRGLQERYLPGDLEVNLNPHKYAQLKELFESHPTGYWIFVVTDHPEFGLGADRIFTKRMQDAFWGLNARTPNRKKLKEGDRVVFCYPKGDAFLGTARLGTDTYEVSEDERKLLSSENEFYATPFGVKLTSIETWTLRRPISWLVDKLSFVKRKQYGASVYLQSGVRAISKDDFERISSSAARIEIPTLPPPEKELLAHIIEYIQSSGYTFSEELVKNYWVCIKTKPFILLTGIAGIGKTALTRLFAGAIGADRNYKRIPVNADWHDDSDLLGYENPLFSPPRYTKTDFLDFMLEAERNPEELFFVCLDEMNLARVEYYFAKFLSGLESDDGVVVLHSSRDIYDPPWKLSIPRNLVFVGTVNMDETAFAFSPKVLDRANSIEISDVDIKEIHAKRGDIHPVRISKSQFEAYRRQVDFENLSATESEYLAELATINESIKVKNQKFGFRVRNEILSYLKNSLNVFSEDPIANARIAFDIEIKQKILPKLTGSGIELKDTLESLQDYFEKKGYDRSLAKVKDMLSRLDRDGFTSFYD